MSTIIAYIVSNPGSIDARVIKMANASVEKGFVVHVFGTLATNFESYEVAENGIIFHRYEWKPYARIIENIFPLKVLNRVIPRLAVILAKVIFKFSKYFVFSTIFLEEIVAVKPDVIHAHDLICLPVAHRAAKKCDIPYIYDAHELEIHRNPPLPFFLKKYVKYIQQRYSKDAARVITVGKHVADILSNDISNQKISVLYNSPVIDKTPYNLRQDLQVTNTTKIILSVGKITIGRGIEDIIHILPSLPQNVVFVAVGPFDPRHKTFLKAQAIRYKVSDRFIILPPVPYYQVVNYIKSADLGIISVQPVTLSYQYCMPNKLFELSFAKVPILSNDLDEIREFIDENSNGKIVDINDSAVLIHQISKILFNTEEYKITDKQYDKLYEKYSWDSQLIKLFGMYKELLTE